MSFKDWNRPGEKQQPQQPGTQEPQGKLDQRDQQKQQGGVGREPNLENGRKQNQPTHQVD
ncbi:MAG TPA: hypothetical protein VLW85_25580 [Myxococcales bacterium]|nr:hypothetical protein [Myxococcales bacterium]